MNFWGVVGSNFQLFLLIWAREFRKFSIQIFLWFVWSNISEIRWGQRFCLATVAAARPAPRPEIWRNIILNVKWYKYGKSSSSKKRKEIWRKKILGQRREMSTTPNSKKKLTHLNRPQRAQVGKRQRGRPGAWQSISNMAFTVKRIQLNVWTKIGNRWVISACT